MCPSVWQASDKATDSVTPNGEVIEVGKSQEEDLLWGGLVRSLENDGSITGTIHSQSLPSKFGTLADDHSPQRDKTCCGVDCFVILTQHGRHISGDSCTSLFIVVMVTGVWSSYGNRTHTWLPHQALSSSTRSRKLGTNNKTIF